MRLDFHGTVQAGKLELERRVDFMTAVRHLDGKDVTLTLEKRSKKRSKSQNNWFHQICHLCSESSGYDFEKVKEIFKQRFLLIADDGKYAYCRATSSLNTAEMALFLENVLRFAAEEWGVVVPDPDPGNALDI